jgi:hypothetical protein
MRCDDPIGINSFLLEYPGMSLRPSRASDIVLSGIFTFSAKPEDGEKIEDSYQIEIVIPAAFPRANPRVTELGKRIPRNADYHVYRNNTLCMGSPIHLLMKIYKEPTLSGFSKTCLIPYLYAMSYKLKNGGSFIFGELAHEKKGLIDDYMSLFGLNTKEQVIQAQNLLGMKKRIANKKDCPCGCGKLLGKCRFNFRISYYRRMAPRSWFKALLSLDK